MRSRWWTVLVLLGELLLCGLLATAWLLFLWPPLWEEARGFLWLDAPSPYRMGDGAGTLFLIVRRLHGEGGGYTHFFAWPRGLSLSDDFPNQLVTDYLALFVEHFGLPLGYNLGVASLLVSNGLAVQLALRVLGVRFAPALLSGVLAAGLEPLLAEALAGRPVTTCWGPAILAVGLGLAALRSWRALFLALPAALLLALAVRVYPFGPVILLAWALPASLLSLGRPARASLVRGALVALWLGLGFVWGAWPYLGLGKDFAMRPPDPRLPAFSLSELASPYGPGGTLWRMPWSWLALALLASLLAPRALRRWLGPALGALFLAGMALGARPPAPLDSIPRGWLPFNLLLGHIPLLRACSRPRRWALGYALLVPLWLGFALNGLSRAGPLRRRLALVLLPLALLGGALQLRCPGCNWRLVRWPPWPVPEEVLHNRVVADFPTYSMEGDVLYFLASWIPTPRLQGARHMDRGTRRERRERWPLLDALEALRWGRETPRAIQDYDSAWELPSVRELGLRHVFVHAGRISREQYRRVDGLLRSLGFQPSWRSRRSEVLLYSLEVPGS